MGKTSREECMQVCAVLGGGGYAEKVNVPAGQLLPIPKGVSLRDAAGIPEVACTVWSTIFMTVHLTKGESLLVPPKKPPLIEEPRTFVCPCRTVFIFIFEISLLLYLSETISRQQALLTSSVTSKYQGSANCGITSPKSDNLSKQLIKTGFGSESC